MDACCGCQQFQEDAVNDALLAEAGRRLPPELSSRFGVGMPPRPEPPPSRGDERPQMIAALETAAFDDMDSEDDDPATVFEPSRVMSGWVAARVLAESGSRQLLLNAAPGAVLGATGASLPVPQHHAHAAGFGHVPIEAAAAPLASTLVDGVNAAGFTVRGGSSQGIGLAVGMGPIRLEMSLMERLAALAARREESDKRFMSLRRHYVNQLRTYLLEMKENSVSLDALREEVAAARAEARPGRPGNFPTDEEEWAAVSRMIATSHAVMRQNLQLRARLARATGRAAGLADASTRSAEADYLVTEVGGAADLLVADELKLQESSVGATSIAATPLRSRRREQAAEPADSRRRGASRRDAASDDGSLRDDDEEEEDMDMDDPYRTTQRSRAGPRRTATQAQAAGVDTLFACGDLVTTPYGRGSVVRQRDADGMVVVRLRWGATVYAPSSQVALLAIAGEEYNGPASEDAGFLLPPFQPALPTAAARNARVPTADELLYGPGGVAAAPKVAASYRSAAPAAGRGAATAASAAYTRREIESGASIVDGLHRGSSTIAVERERDEETAAAMRAQKKVKTASGVPITNRNITFRTSWSVYGAPRGVPLRIDAARGTQTGGFFIGTVDGIGDAQRVFTAGGLSQPSSATRGRLDSVGSYGDSMGMHRAYSMSGGMDASFSPPFTGREGAAPGVPDLRGSGGAALAASLNAAAGAAAPGVAFQPAQPALGSPGVAGTGASVFVSGMPDIGASPLHHLSGHGGSTATALQRYRAEVQRLYYQLRTAEESRREQRQRLTEARVTTSKLLEQLNGERTQLAVVARELARRDTEIADLTARLGRMYERFAPEAEKHTWASLQAAISAERNSNSDRSQRAAAGTSEAASALDILSGAADDDEGEEAPPARARAGKRSRSSRGGAAARRGASARAPPVVVREEPEDEAEDAEEEEEAEDAALAGGDDPDDDDADDAERDSNEAAPRDEGTGRASAEDAEEAGAMDALGSMLRAAANGDDDGEEQTPADSGDLMAGLAAAADEAEAEADAVNALSAAASGNQIGEDADDEEAGTYGGGRGRGGRRSRAAGVDATAAPSAAGTKRRREAALGSDSQQEAGTADEAPAAPSRRASGARQSRSKKTTSPQDGVDGMTSGDDAAPRGSSEATPAPTVDVDEILAAEPAEPGEEAVSEHVVAAQAHAAAVREEFPGNGAEKPRSVSVLLKEGNKRVSYGPSHHKVTTFPGRAGTRLGAKKA